MTHMLRIAIIGTGNISAMHLKGYLTFPERCQIVALCDIYPEKAEEKKITYDLKDAVVYDNHKSMLEAGSYDLVSICTPPYTHASLAIDCMRAGNNVLIEKPMAASLEECDLIRQAEKETGRIASSVAQNRFRTGMMSLKKTLDAKLIGQVLHAQVDSFWWRGHNYYDLWWRGTWDKEAGGCTLNHAVHHIDLLNWMMGKTPNKVSSVIANLAHDNSEVEDLSVSVLSYDESVATLTGSVIHHGEEQKLIFQGLHAEVSYPFSVHASTAKDNGFPIVNKALEEKIKACFDEQPALAHEGHTAQIDDVLSAVEQYRAPFIGTQDGRNTIELITAIYKAGSTGQSVSLPIRKDDLWYTVKGILASARHFYEKTTSVTTLGSNEITVGGSKQK